MDSLTKSSRFEKDVNFFVLFFFFPDKTPAFKAIIFMKRTNSSSRGISHRFFNLHFLAKKNSENSVVSINHSIYEYNKPLEPVFCFNCLNCTVADYRPSTVRLQLKTLLPCILDQELITSTKYFVINSTGNSSICL